MTDTHNFNWVYDIGDAFTRDQEDAIVKRCLRPECRVDIQWVGVPVEHGKHKGHVCVATDALRLRHPFVPIRITVTCRAAQELCDKLGLQMPTPLMVDRVWEASTLRVNPKTYLPDNDSMILVHDRLDDSVTTPMHSLTAMIAHSDRISDEVKESKELTCNVGKWWVITHGIGLPRLGGYTCANYGWFHASAPSVSVTGKRLWQPLAMRHNQNHRDYSQTFVPVGRHLIVDDERMTVEQVLCNPKLCGLLNHNGPLYSARHPSMPLFEIEHDLSPDPETVPIVGGFPSETPTRPDGMPAPEFIQARHYTRATDRKVDYLVIHTMENSEKPKTARAVANWFAGSNAPRASAHYCIDNAQVIQCVKERDVAWCAPGTNRNGVHLEHAGYASQTFEQWRDVYSTSMLNLSAKLASEICRRHSIPVQFVNATGLLTGVRGITTHAEVTKACTQAKRQNYVASVFYRAKSDHTDPGYNFPIVSYVNCIRKNMGK